MRKLFLICLLVSAAWAKYNPAKFEQLEQQLVPIEEVPVESASQGDSSALLSVKKSNYGGSQSQGSSSQSSSSYGSPSGTDSLVTYNPVRYNVKVSSKSPSGSSGPTIQGAVQQVSRTVTYRKVNMPATSARPSMKIEIGPNPNQLHFLFKSRSSSLFDSFGSSPSAAKPDTSVYFRTEEQPMRLVQTIRSQPGVHEYTQYMRPVQYSTHVMKPVQESVTRVVATSGSGGRHSQSYQTGQVYQGQAQQIQAGQMYEIPTQTRIIMPTITYSNNVGNNAQTQTTYYRPAKITHVKSGKSAFEAAREILGEDRFNQIYGNTNIQTQSKPLVFHSSQKQTKTYVKPGTSQNSYSYYSSSSSSSGGSASPLSKQTYTSYQSVPAQQQTYVSNVQTSVRPAAAHVIQQTRPLIAHAQATIDQIAKNTGGVYFNQGQQQTQVQQAQPLNTQTTDTSVAVESPAPSAVHIGSSDTQTGVVHQQQQAHRAQEVVQPVQPLQIPVATRVEETRPVSAPEQFSQVKIDQVDFNQRQQQQAQPQSAHAVQTQYYQVQSQPAPVVQPQAYQQALQLNFPAAQEQVVPTFQTVRTVQVRPLVQETHLITPQSPQSKVIQQTRPAAPISVAKFVDNPTVIRYKQQGVQNQEQHVQQQQTVVQQQAQPLQTQTTGTAVTIESGLPSRVEVDQQTGNVQQTGSVYYGQDQQTQVQQAQPLNTQSTGTGTSVVNFRTVAKPIVFNKVQTKYVQEGSEQSSHESSSSSSATTAVAQPIPAPLANNQLESSVEYAQEAESGVQAYAQPAILDQTVPSQPDLVSTNTGVVSSSAATQEQNKVSKSSATSSSVPYGTRFQPARPLAQPDQTEQIQQTYLTSEDDGVDSSK